MSKKASNSCFRHLNPKHKVWRRSTPRHPHRRAGPKAHRPGFREPPAGELPAGTVLLPKPYKESEILGDPEIRGLTRRSKQMALTMPNGFQSERCRFGVF
jgi:hypothetical protein